MENKALVKLKLNEILHDCTAPGTTSTGTYTCLLGRFQLKRQIGSYLVGTYVPAFLIVIVSWLTFWVSPDAIPARVTLGLLTLISLLTKLSNPEFRKVINQYPKNWKNEGLNSHSLPCTHFVSDE
ncbi:hypothetical protein ACTXT7_009000 [Hymenolepis weldensis]